MSGAACSLRRAGVHDPPRVERQILVGAAFVVVAIAALAAASSCAIRVGSGGPAVESAPLSACALSGGVKKLPFGVGSEAFAFEWDTDHYVVAYVDASTGSGDIDVARVAPDGSLLGAPVAVEVTPAKSDLPNLLKTAGGYLVVWQEGTSATAVFAHALGADAAPVGDGVAIAATQSNQSRPVLAHAPGGRVAVSWMDSLGGKGGVQVALVDPATLEVTGPLRVAQGDSDGWPWLAGDDQTLGMAWSDRPGGSYDVRFASIDAETLTASRAVSLRGAAPHDGLLPRLIRTNFGFLSAWEDQRGGDNQIYMALVDAQGRKIAGGLVEEPNTGDANWPNLAWTGSAAGIVYYQYRTGRPQIFMSFVDGAGERVGGLHDVQVSNAASGWSRYPDVAWNGKQFGVMYVDTRDGPSALWSSGRVLRLDAGPARRRAAVNERLSEPDTNLALQRRMAFETDRGSGSSPRAAREEPVAELLREALGETRDLVRIEVALAREDLRSAFSVAKISVFAIGSAAALTVAAFTMFIVTIVLALKAGWVGALVAGGLLLAVAATLGLAGWRAMPKELMGETKERLQADVKQLREKIA